MNSVKLEYLIWCGPNLWKKRQCIKVNSLLFPFFVRLKNRFWSALPGAMIPLFGHPYIKQALCPHVKRCHYQIIQKEYIVLRASWHHQSSILVCKEYVARKVPLEGVRQFPCLLGLFTEGGSIAQWFGNFLYNLAFPTLSINLATYLNFLLVVPR